MTLASTDLFDGNTGLKRTSLLREIHRERKPESIHGSAKLCRGRIAIALAIDSTKELMRRIILIAAVVCSAVAANAAATPAEKCQAGKTQEAGKYASCRLKAQAKLTQGGDLARYNTALDRCADKLEKRFLKLEEEAVSRGATCPTTSDAADAIALVGSCADTVAEGTSSGGSFPVSCTGPDCGDGLIDAGEDCDLGNLNGGSCANEGFVGGVLACGAGCVFDTSECYAARFVDNANGTITDNETGLMWEKKIKLDGTNDHANQQDADDGFLWSGSCSLATTSRRCQPDAASELACLAGVEGDATGCTRCTGGEGICDVGSDGATIWQWVVALNSASFGGHDDWRLPTRRELESLIDLSDTTAPAVNVAFDGASCSGTCTEVAEPACSCTAQSNGYWSASSYWPLPTSAWFVSFSDGLVFEGFEANDFRVRAVRGGS